MEHNDDQTDEKTENDNKTRVIIIGAGIAGLSVAYHLSKNGFNDFKLLEARNRIGGRIIQIKMGNENIELGANWIHGVLGNPVYELAMHYGLVDILQAPKPHRIVASTEKGKQVPFSILKDTYEAYLCFLKRCEEYFISQYLPPEGIESVGEHIQLEVNMFLDKITDSAEKHMKKLIFECFLKRETCISGCNDMSEIDLLELGSYTELQGGNVTLPNGYSSILDNVSKDIPEKNVFLNHAVSSISYSCSSSKHEDGNESDDSDKTIIDDNLSGRSSSEKEVPNVEITCTNGKKFFGEYAVCTIPLGVLKHRANTLFHPPLPDYKLEALEKLLFGTVDKILLEYDRPFLNANITEVLFLWEPDEKSDVDLSKSWFKKIYSFAKVSETLLLGWISGKEAEYMETLSNDIIINVCTDILRKFLNDPFIPKPKKCVCTSWASQQYTRGSYTAIAVGSSQIDIEYLAQPIFLDDTEEKPVVLFAGEHTHSNFYSTVHGAFLTGRTAAQTILHTDVSKEIVLDCDDDTTDLSSWIQGICLE